MVLVVNGITVDWAKMVYILGCYSIVWYLIEDSPNRWNMGLG